MPAQSLETRIAQQLNLQPRQVSATIRLLDEGNTVPFVARYRKEMTLNLDELLIRKVQETATQIRAVDERRETIITSITEQEKLTPALQQQLEDADTLTDLEDLYQPYRPKRRTRAGTARENGLEKLAEMILKPPSDTSPKKAAKAFLNDEVKSIEDALAGARDIVAEVISDDASVRGKLREKALQWGSISSKQVKDSDDPKGTYKTYYEFSGRVNHIKPYQTLALNRGEREKILRVKIDISERDWRDAIYSKFRPGSRGAWSEQMSLALEDAAKRLLVPAIERDVRRTLSDTAENHAIEVFAENLRNLLNQPPVQGHTVLGIDPAYRTGCKLAVVDASGRVLHTGAIYPHKPQSKYKEAQSTLADLIAKYAISLIAIGNGTASRETESLVADLTRERKNVHYVMVNEAGASVYSASELAREEMPDLDVTLRGAVSIARRLQDPLAELVKIDPKSIGVGLYQHDLNQTALSSALDAVVESVVNQVGVDVNTASPALLAYVAGVGAKLAKNIVLFRDENGAFKSRSALNDVSGMGAKSFEQSAGFLRVRDGKNPLDASAIHPESYKVAKAVLQRARLKSSTALEQRENALSTLREQTSVETLAQELKTGILTLEDIFEQLIRPGRDPREDLPPPVLRSDVLSMEDLQPGMVLAGTVRNVVDFGAFIDIGVKQDGLLHISKIPAGASPGVGDVLQVEILTVDADRGRIGLGWVSV